MERAERREQKQLLIQQKRDAHEKQKSEMREELEKKREEKRIQKELKEMERLRLK